MKRAVVTGGAGFIGSHLTEALLKKGYDVLVLDTLVAGKRELIPARVRFAPVDVRDREALLTTFAGADIVFHLAARPRVEDSLQRPLDTHDVNVNGVLHVLDAARSAGVRRVVLASTCAIYGAQTALPFAEDLLPMPLSPYALHKYFGEHYLRLYATLFGLETVSLRLFNVYGPRLDPNGPYALVIGKFLKLRSEGLPLTITGDGTQTRDFVHVTDVVRAFISAGEGDRVGKGEVINIGTGIETSVNTLADLFGGERLYVPARQEPRAVAAHIERARKYIEWEPAIALRDGLAPLLGIAPLNFSVSQNATNP